MYIPNNEILNSIFFDIETIPKCKYSELSDLELRLWSSIAQKLRYKNVEDKDKTDEELWPNAGLYGEFGKIICIAFGLYNSDKNTIYFRELKGENEISTIHNFFEILSKLELKSSSLMLAGYNIENFDIPFILKRCLILGIKPHNLFNSYGKKPWDIHNLDLAKVWMGTGFQDRYMVKLEILCYSLGVETPKTDLYGGNVYDYYLKGHLDQISHYCGKDVIATIQCTIKLSDFKEKFNTIKCITI